MTVYNPTPVCVCVYRSDKFGIVNGKKPSCVRSRKNLINFNNFCGTVQSRIPQNLCKIRHRLPCETKEKSVIKRDIWLAVEKMFQNLEVSYSPENLMSF